MQHELATVFDDGASCTTCTRPLSADDVWGIVIFWGGILSAPPQKKDAWNKLLVTYLVSAAPSNRRE